MWEALLGMLGMGGKAAGGSPMTGMAKQGVGASAMSPMFGGGSTAALPAAEGAGATGGSMMNLMKGLFIDEKGGLKGGASIDMSDQKSPQPIGQPLLAFPPMAPPTPISPWASPPTDQFTQLMSFLSRPR